MSDADGGTSQGGGGGGGMSQVSGSAAKENPPRAIAHVRRRSSFGDQPSTADEAIARLEEYTDIVDRLESEVEVLRAQRDRAQREGESLRSQAMAQVQSLQKALSAKTLELGQLRDAASREVSAKSEATNSDLARALARVQELEDRQKLQARAYRKQRAELLHLRATKEKAKAMKQKYAERIAEAEQQAQDLMRERDEEVKGAREEIEHVKAKAQADVANALAQANASQEEAARIQDDLSETKSMLQRLKDDYTHSQVAIEKERRDRHELVSKVQQDALSQRQKLARRVAKLTADLAACNDSLSAEKRSALRANAEMLKLLASLETTERKHRTEAEARATESKEHAQIVARMEREHLEHAENLRRAYENREAALISQHKHEHPQLGLIMNKLDNPESELRKLSTLSSSPASSSLSSSPTSLVKHVASTNSTQEGLSEYEKVNCKETHVEHLKNTLVTVQAEVVALEKTVQSKERELEAVRRQHEAEMSKVRERTEMRIGELMQRLDERHKKSLAENAIVEGEERKGDGRNTARQSIESLTEASTEISSSSNNASSNPTPAVTSIDYANELRQKYHQSLHELNLSRAGEERLMAERASFASQVASMDAQLKAMRSLVKQLEQARDATAIQHGKERSMLETQVLRLVEAVRKSAHGTPTFGKAKGDLEDFVVPLFEQLVGQIYLFASEVVVLRRRVNDYTEALLSKAWEKEAQFRREFNQAGTENKPSAGLAQNKDEAMGTPLSTLVLGEDDEEEEDEEEEEDDDCATVGGNSPNASDCTKSEENGALGNVDVSGESLVASSAEFMDDDKADEILRQLQADAPLKKLSPVYD
eukprot:g4171.t1